MIPTCSKHGEALHVTPGGRRYCKTCQSLTSKLRYEKNKEAIKQRVRNYQTENRDSINTKKKARYDENRELFADRSKAYTEKVGPEKLILRSMISRCTNPNDSAYATYGAKEREIGKEFLGEKGYDNFLAEVGPRPPGKTEGGVAEYTIERLDNTKGYVSGNLAWRDRTVQNNNRSNNLEKFSYRGIDYTLQELSNLCGLSYSALWNRIIRLKWDVTTAVDTPSRGNGSVAKSVD